MMRTHTGFRIVWPIARRNISPVSWSVFMVESVFVKESGRQAASRSDRPVCCRNTSSRLGRVRVSDVGLRPAPSSRRRIARERGLAVVHVEAHDLVVVRGRSDVRLRAQQVQSAVAIDAHADGNDVAGHPSPSVRRVCLRRRRGPDRRS